MDFLEWRRFFRAGVSFGDVCGLHDHADNDVEDLKVLRETFDDDAGDLETRENVFWKSQSEDVLNGMEWTFAADTSGTESILVGHTNLLPVTTILMTLLFVLVRFGCDYQGTKGCLEERLVEQEQGRLWKVASNIYIYIYVQQQLSVLQSHKRQKIAVLLANRRNVKQCRFHRNPPRHCQKIDHTIHLPKLDTIFHIWTPLGSSE